MIRILRGRVSRVTLSTDAIVVITAPFTSLDLMDFLNQQVKDYCIVSISSRWFAADVNVNGAGGLPRCGDIATELRDELLNGEIFYSLKEAKIVIEQWRKHYNTVRPHSSLNYRPPAPQTFAPVTNHLDEIMPMQ